MLESSFQADTIKMITRLLPGVLVLKNDLGYLLGVPDYSIFYGSAWAWLEFKRAADSPTQPNQPYYVQWADLNSFGSFIYPENRDAVLNDMFRFLRANAAKVV